MKPIPPNRSVLLVGNFLSDYVGNYCVCEELAANLRSAGLNVITTSSRRARVPRLVDMVSTILRRRREYSVAHVDVYSGLAFGLAEASCFTLRRLGKPYVLTLHGGNLPLFAKRWPGRVRRLLTGANVVTTPSRYLSEQLKDYRSDIKLLPNPLSLDCYPCRLRNSTKPRIVWVRSFHRIYNPLLAVKVVAELVPQFPDLQLTMVGHDKGDGSLQETQQLAQALAVTKHIEFVGGVPKETVPTYLDQNDLFINTTNIDNTPVSVLEAMACGLCVVSTKVGGIPYLLNDGKDSLLVPRDDADAMARSVRNLLTTPGLSQQISSAGRHHVEQFDWSVVLPQWQDLLHTVADEKAA